MCGFLDAGSIGISDPDEWFDFRLWIWWARIKNSDDHKGKDGDIRDILVIIKGIEWEIGLSVKHNHFAVKHSRLSKGLDFGEKWYGIKFSDKYWEDITPIFDYLEDEKAKG